ncbi:MAG: hypothetical protein J6P71_07070, partial [Oscillospiraceae bacterium]|nr:hypothetical protein [Oscillospiraceae bacterium]
DPAQGREERALSSSAEDENKKHDDTCDEHRHKDHVPDLEVYARDLEERGEQHEIARGKGSAAQRQSEEIRYSEKQPDDADKRDGKYSSSEKQRKRKGKKDDKKIRGKDGGRAGEQPEKAAERPLVEKLEDKRERKRYKDR